MSLRGIGCAEASPVRLVGVIKAGSSATFGHSWTASKTVSQTTKVTVEPGKVVWIARSAAMRSVGRRPSVTYRRIRRPNHRERWTNRRLASGLDQTGLYQASLVNGPV